MLYMNPPLNSFKSDTLTEQIADIFKIVCLLVSLFVVVFLFLLFSCDFVAFLVKKNISDNCKEAFW